MSLWLRNSSFGFLMALCVLATGQTSLYASEDPAVSQESEFLCRFPIREGRERVTVIFNISNDTDPNVTFIGFLQEDATGRNVVSSLPITMPSNGSGSLPPLSLNVSSSARNAVTFGVKIISSLGVVSSGEIQATVITKNGASVYDMNPSSHGFIIDEGAQVAVLEYKLPIVLL